jgi:hypothetical protein
MTNGAAFGLGVGVGFALSLARLALWMSPLRPKSRRAKIAVFLGTTILIRGERCVHDADDYCIAACLGGQRNRCRGVDTDRFAAGAPVAP